MTGCRCPQPAGSGANFKDQLYILQLWKTASLLTFGEEELDADSASKFTRSQHLWDVLDNQVCGLGGELGKPKTGQMFRDQPDRC